MSEKTTPRKIHRRTFVRSIAYAGAMAPFVSPRLVRAVSANGKVRHVCVGGGGMGEADMQSFNRSEHFELFAVCDVDSKNFKLAKQLNPNCKTYGDFRELIDKEEKNFDSANVTIPDHMHAAVAMSMINAGKHVYCQKPLTHDIYEARKLTEAAAKAGVVSQMGIQIHSHIAYRMAAELVQRGVIGKIKEVYSFSGKKWGGGTIREGQSDPVPDTLNWDHWIGNAPFTPYVNGQLHQGNWRKFLDYGTGTFGDMGCHIYDPVYKALGVKYPISITSRGKAPTKHGWALEAEVEYIYPGTEYTLGETVKVTWFDGNRRNRVPQHAVEALGGLQVPDQGSIFLGEKGAMLLPHISGPQVVPRELMVEFVEAGKRPELPPQDHWFQFIDAVRGEDKTSAHFGYAGPLTESILAGGIATRFPDEKLLWDGDNLKFTNKPEANKLVRREYRSGWDIDRLS